jgi:cytosine/adenosine deaminase-related metal-dependent hydrolase
MCLKIANGTLVTRRGDLVCRDGIIEQVGEVDQAAVDEVVDASFAANILELLDRVQAVP